MANDHTASDQRTDGDRAETDGSAPGRKLGDLDEALESLDYPTDDTMIVEAYGGYEVETRDGREPVAELLDADGDETYDSADDVRKRVLKVINRR